MVKLSSEITVYRYVLVRCKKVIHVSRPHKQYSFLDYFHKHKTKEVTSHNLSITQYLIVFFLHFGCWATVSVNCT